MGFPPHVIAWNWLLMFIANSAKISNHILGRSPGVTTSREDWRLFEPWTNARKAYVESFTGPLQRHLSEMS